jgi:Ser/Thr protein kinase RdoA (MazF antagonist)
MPGDVREQWLATIPTFVESCLRLDELGPGPTLVHGDLHPWNVAHGPATTRVFDWTDAAVSHPFVDLATYVFRSDDTAVRRRLVDAYVDAWSAVGPAKSLREAASLGLVVGALYQVQTYRALLPTLVGNGADAGLADADLSWVKRSLTRHEHGLESPA